MKYSIVCGEYVSSKMNGVKSGTFNFDSSLLSGNDSLLCLFKFVGDKNEKVMLKFDKLDVKSLAPEYETFDLKLMQKLIQLNKKNFIFFFKIAASTNTWISI